MKREAEEGRRIVKRFAFSACLALSGALAAAAAQSAPYPSAATPHAIDRGVLDAQEAKTPISITIALALPGLDEAENLQKSLYTRGDPLYPQFLTADQFAARFAPTNADVAKVVAALAKYGLSADRTTATTLRVTGLPADLERAFSVTLHSYEVPAHDQVPGYGFHAPLTRATIPSEISSAVVALVGLDNRPSAHPLYKTAPVHSPASAAPAASNLPDPFGSLTVTDFAQYYDVNPLYKKGLSGAGRTIGIMTLASFTQEDAYAYWSSLGLDVNSKRITIVNVDDGPGKPTDGSGSIETTIDVEQSGGIAPGAKIVVYQAPNTNQGFVDVFAVAIEANLAETLSISWGDWEWFGNLENAPVTDPATGNTVSTTQAVHELLLRASIQGQTTFAAAGDGGAYDLNNDLSCYGPYSATKAHSCSLTLSVDYPASDTLMTAAGGTTLPGLQEDCLNAACTPPFYPIHIQHEQVWGWDYLKGFCKAMGFSDPISCGTFPGGGGGGVSITFLVPEYQLGLPGVQLSQPDQLYQAGTHIAEKYDVGTEYFLPQFYPGRNVPDISFNADPMTGYVVYYTSNKSGFGVDTLYGGTSFVGPQLNGVSALLGQDFNQRLGFLNTALYGLVQSGQAYSGPDAPLRAIAYGDNWFYQGSNGYNPGAGLGVMDVANFAKALKGEF
jgi:kumamolisin